MNDLGSIWIKITYADTALANRIRAWARKNRSVANLAPYTRGCYEGHVIITARIDEPRDSVLARADSLRALPGFKTSTERGV